LLPLPQKHEPPDRPPWPRLTLRRLDQAAAAAVLAAALALIAGHWLWPSGQDGRLIEIDRVDPMAIDFQVDINQADWPELALLPGVGQVLARRIVVERNEHGPYRDLSDLRRVRGIGPKTLDGMRPYLLPMADLEATAGGEQQGKNEG
jgi:competence protein ComEA